MLFACVKMTSEELLMRGKEKLTVEQSSEEKKVRNEGFTTSLIIGVFAVNPEYNNIKYAMLDAPVAVKTLSTEEISLPQKRGFYG